MNPTTAPSPASDAGSRSTFGLCPYDPNMPRRIWIPLGFVAVATAGYLFAVLVPNDSVLVSRSPDQQPPPAVTFEKTITIPPGEPLRHSAEEVGRAFTRGGL